MFESSYVMVEGIKYEIFDVFSILSAGGIFYQKFLAVDDDGNLVLLHQDEEDPFLFRYSYWNNYSL